MRNVSDEMKEAVFAQRTGEAFIVLLKLEHDDLAEPIYITTDPMEVLSTDVRGVISNGIEYTFLPFEIVLPGEDEDSPPVSKVRIDNITREIVTAVRTIRDAPNVTISIVMSSDPDTEEVSISGFQLNNVRADAFTVEGDLTTERLDVEPFPSGRFTPALFPGLF